MKIRIISFLILFAFLTAPVFSDENQTPEEYTEEEFSEFQRGLRRAEIVFIGSLPFTFFFSSLGYDVGRYVGIGIDYGFDSDKARIYAPLFFGSTTLKPEFTQDELIGVFLGSLALSLIVTIIDAIIYDSKSEE